VDKGTIVVKETIMATTSMDRGILTTTKEIKTNITPKEMLPLLGTLQTLASNVAK